MIDFFLHLHTKVNIHVAVKLEQSRSRRFKGARRVTFAPMFYKHWLVFFLPRSDATRFSCADHSNLPIYGLLLIARLHLIRIEPPTDCGCLRWTSSSLHELKQLKTLRAQTHERKRVNTIVFREQNVVSGLIFLPAVLKRVRERFDARSVDVGWPGASSKESLDTCLVLIFDEAKP